MSFESHLRKIVERSEEINQRLMQSNSINPKELTALSKEQAEISDLVELSREYLDLIKKIEENESAIADKSNDSELIKMFEEDLYALNKALPELKERLQVLLIPKDKDDDKNVILEIRAGTGGDEAALFAAVLLRMYQKYSERMRWQFEILSIVNTGLHGCKEVSVSINGRGVFSKLKFESGVHRVQRVPETEASGRLHTSAATVAILPEAEDLDIKINENDLRIDVFRASGSGGQHVNTTDSAVRITHLPSGLVVSQQDEKSQHKNKAKALKILRSRLYELEKTQQDMELSKMRKGQVGSGDRSERIRTYNYPQNRVTDHRINLTLYHLTEIVNEGELDEIINALLADDQINKLANLKF